MSGQNRYWDLHLWNSLMNFYFGVQPKTTKNFPKKIHMLRMYGIFTYIKKLKRLKTMVSMYKVYITLPETTSSHLKIGPNCPKNETGVRREEGDFGKRWKYLNKKKKHLDMIWLFSTNKITSRTQESYVWQRVGVSNFKLGWLGWKIVTNPGIAGHGSCQFFMQISQQPFANGLGIPPNGGD